MPIAEPGKTTSTTDQYSDWRSDLLTPSNPFAYTGGLYSPEMAAAFTSKLAALRQGYESTLAALKGQRTNIKAQFKSQVAGIKGTEVSTIVQAEGQAVERGVLGGSADIKNRIGIRSQTAADIEAARLAKQQDILDTYQKAAQATTDYYLGQSDVEIQRSSAMAAATANALANNAIDTTGRNATFKSIPRNGDFGDVVLGIGNTQVNKAAYIFNTQNPGVSFDCSGFTSWVYETATGIALPHSARAQMSDPRLTSVSASGLKPGDLVFFWYPNTRGIPSGEASHVGIFIGLDENGNQMVMDASQSGNTIVRRVMDAAHFIGARRVPWALLPRWSQNAA